MSASSSSRSEGSPERTSARARGRGAASRGGTWLALGAAVVVATALATFAWLHGTLVRERDALAEQHRLAFGPDVLGRAGEFDFSFGVVNRLAGRLSQSPRTRALMVSKVLEDREAGVAGATRERLIAPYWLGRDDVALATAGLRRLPIDLNNDGTDDAWVYVGFDDRLLNILAGWMVALGGLLAGLVAAVLLRARRTERRLATTTIALDEKRRELIRAERLALVGQVAANLLHDLRKPVATIRALADESDERFSPEAGATLKDVRDQADAFTGILSAAKIERFAQAGGDPEWCDLHEILDRSVRLVRYEQGEVEVRREFAAARPLVEANPYELIQVFSNLILNAFQALRGNGTLALRTRDADADGALVVEIEDSGAGVAAEMRARLFTPFETTRREEGGSGLGTYIAREIVGALGGTLELAAPGTLGGARFVVRWPNERRS